MTSSTTAPTRTGSMSAPTLAPLTSVGKSPEDRWLGALATRWGLRESYTRQQVFADFGVFDRAAEAVEEMLKDGRADLVALRCARLDAVRSAGIVAPSVDAHRDLLHENFERDAAENPATAAHAMDLTRVTWDTARRLLVKEVAAKMRLIRSGDLLYRERLA